MSPVYDHVPLLAPLPALVAFLPPATAFVEEYATVDEALRRAFPRAEAFEPRRVLVDDEQAARLEKRVRDRRVSRIFRYWVATRGEETLGYAVVDDVLGKSQPITYMLATDAGRSASAVEVLVYRESHGYEIRREAFRRQFVGKTAGDVLRVDRDVRNIAGATISCHSITDGVHDQLALLQELVGRPAEVRPAATPPPAEDGNDAGGALRRTQVLMGTTLEIAVHARSSGVAQAATGAAFAEVARLEALLSAFRPESDVRRLNAAAGGEPIEVAPETRACLEQALLFARSTGGAFGVTAAPAAALWRASAERGAEPDEHAVASARALCAPEVLVLERDRVGLLAGAAVDLGAIGKGFALDRAADVLREHGVDSALLNFGGQLLALEPPPGEDAWTVELRDPRAPERIARTVALARASLATTADYERGLRIGGRAYSHVVDPRTARPCEGLLGVSVVARTACEADALSTALFVLGSEEGRAFAERRGVQAWFFQRDGAARDEPERNAAAPRR